MALENKPSLTSIYRQAILCLTILLLASCNQQNQSQSHDICKEDSTAKHMFQGIWIDEESENVVFKVKGDSVYYPDATSLPSFFMIHNDSLIVGTPPSHYPIKKQTANTFWFINQTGDLMKLYKSTDPRAELAFVVNKPQTTNQIKDVIKNDTVLIYKNERYHCYIAINPTKYKVLKQTFNEDGVEVNTIYYDNIIHISVYHGTKCLYSNDIKKSMFTKHIPHRFLSQAILDNIQFYKVDPIGFHFHTKVCIPDGASCYLLDTIISFDGKMDMKVIEY